MRIPLALLADHASLTNDGKLNILGIFEAFRAKEIPTTLAAMSVVFQLVEDTPRTSEPYRVAVRCRAPDGREVFMLDGKLNVRDGSEPLNVPQIIRIENLRIEAYGRHLFEVLVDGEGLSGIPLDVIPSTPE